MFRVFVFLFVSMVSAVCLIAGGVGEERDDVFRLVKVNAAEFYERCPEALIMKESEGSHENYELRDHDDLDLSYEQFAEKHKAFAEMLDRKLNESFLCDICGTYLFYKGSTKIGMISLSNGKSEFYGDKTYFYGFTTGQYVCRDIFLDEGHKGKGYFKYLHEKVMELITPFLGKKHLVCNEVGKLVESDLPFQGTRGLTDLSNIPSLRASLKAGATLVDIPEDRDQWVVQFPGKDELSAREVELRRVADLIIVESLQSFRDAECGISSIPSTHESREAVSRHYYNSIKLFPDGTQEEMA